MNAILLRIFAITCGGSSVNLFGGQCQKTDLPTTPASSTELRFVLQIVFGILAAVAVLFVVIGGLRYTISGGDSQDMARAKNTIIYAIVGLIIALFAEAIVSFAIGYI